MSSADRHPRGDSWSWTDRAEVRSAEVLAGRMGGIKVKNWQTYSDLTIVAGYAPQESGPSEQKEHFWDHVTKTLAKLPKRT